LRPGLWVKDSGKITQEDLQFNEKYADYLAILNAPEENMVDEYYQNMLEELRTGINTKTGKPLTTLEQVQRWSAVASFVAVLAIGSYYSVKGLTGTKTTAKQPKSTTKATVPKAKLPSDPTQGRQLKVKKADIPAGKSRGIAAPKKASGAKIPTLNSLSDEVASSLGGKASPLKNGYKVEIPNGRKPIVVRIMDEGSGGRGKPYYRVSIDGKGSLTPEGIISSDRGLTHIDLSENSLSEITNIINNYLGRK
jgi:hypothetical protein